MRGRFERTTVIVPPAFGATLLATIPLRVLHRKDPSRPLACIARYPELLEGLPYLSELSSDSGTDIYPMLLADREVVDLNGTLDFQPHRRVDDLHLAHLLCSKAGVEVDVLRPECALSESELQTARTEMVWHKRRAREVPTVLFTTRTSTANKEWPWVRWNELIQRTKATVRWLHVGGRALWPALPDVTYLHSDLRRTIALAAVADGIVTLDTFLLHAAAAARSHGDPHVVTLLGSTRPGCVSYPSFENLYVESLDCQPCGRPFHRFDLSFGSEGLPLTAANGRPQGWTCPHVDCMSLLSVDLVEQAIRRRIIEPR